MTTSVLVIGAGIGGLTAAIHLARSGFHVSVLEKNAQAGGRCDRFSLDGHQFDTGPTLFVFPRLYEAEFRCLGADLKERLELLPVDPTYRLVFDNGSQLALTPDMGSMREQLEDFEPGSFQGLGRYLADGACPQSGFPPRLGFLSPPALAADRSACAAPSTLPPHVCLFR
jgi:phytoene dehydrogenase-like protein